MARGIIVRGQELAGRWSVLGSDAARGITVEDLVVDADAWGPRSATFTLRRNGRIQWPDIGAYAPIEIEAGGILVWSGRVKGTPTTDGADRRMSVNAEGWSYHLDDDSFQRTYVHTDLADYKNVRSSLATNLAVYRQAGVVEAGTSAIVLTFPNGVVQPASNLCGVTLDFGPSLCKVVTFNWESSNNAAPFSLLCDGHDVPDGAQSGSVETAITFTLASGASGGTGALTFTTPRRYVSFILSSGAGATPGADCWIRINLVWTFSDASYISSNISVLKASTVVADAVSRATLLLSPDTSKIEATSFNIPSLAMTKPASPRDVINAVNAYHDYQASVDADRRVVFRPKPANATIQVDARSEFDEASAGDASEIYSNVNVTYTDEANQPQSVQRGQVSSQYQASLVQPTNPGAEVNTTNWAVNAGAGTLARTTVGGEFSAGVGGFKLTAAATGSGSASMSAAWSGGSFVAGQTYRLTIDARAATSATYTAQVFVLVDGIGVAGAALTPDNTFHTVTLDWVAPSSTAPTIRLNFAGPTGSAISYWDNLILYETAPTIVNRRRFRRTFTLDTNMSLTAAAAQQIGDAYLLGHRTTPMKGKLVCSGYGAASKTPSGVRMPPAELLLNTGELVRFAHLIDPDTGAIGREGRIASVSWDAASDTATIEIDSLSTSFEALIARLGILTGSVQ